MAGLIVMVVVMFAGLAAGLVTLASEVGHLRTATDKDRHELDDARARLVLVERKLP